ncbi:MAG TPA: hypothetical protein VK570_10195 [Rubrivivax sp.]|nr:hypothetical protein [Rubrivivax sp.]
MRNTLRFLALITLLLLLSAIVSLAAALQHEPAVVLRAQPDQNDVGRALNLLRAHDPRQARVGALRAVHINQHEVDVLLNHAGRRWFDTATQVRFERGAAVVRASVHLPAHPLAFMGRWLNVQVRLVETGGLPAVLSWQIGGLPLPAALAETALLRAAARAGLTAELQLAGELVRRVNFLPQHLAVVYAWQADSTDRVLGVLLPAADQSRLRAYNDRLAELLAATGPQWTTSLAPLLGPLFKLAQERSRDGEAAAENRAALVVLAVFASGRPLGSLVPAARSWPRPRRLQLTLAGREDFPLHFLISAALAAEGTGPLSKAIGIYKEVADARQGSGFSFNDMAANRAGTRFGERAVAEAPQLQALLAGGVQEADFMPEVSDLPEFMNEADFARRFGGVGQPAYTKMMAEIESRVAALPVMR